MNGFIFSYVYPLCTLTAVHVKVIFTAYFSACQLSIDAYLYKMKLRAQSVCKNSVLVLGLMWMVVRFMD